MNRLQFLGHATVHIELDGVRLLTDPILRGRVPGLLHRHPVRDVAAIVNGLHMVLISHLHHDHLDVPSLRRVSSDARLLVPHGGAGLLARNGWPEAEELSAGDRVDVGPIRVLATQAVHIGYRAPFGPLGGSLGYVLEGSRRIYFAGDTAVFEGMRDLAPVDVALLPVAGWGPKLGPGHMGPHQALEAVHLLRPRLTIPIHWGSLVPFGLHYREWPYLRQPPCTFADLVRKEMPSVRVVVLRPGQSLRLSRS